MSLTPVYYQRLKAIGLSQSEAESLINSLNGRSISCSICSGFYGESFRDSVCSTCHEFLFPQWNQSQLKKSSVDETDSDADSGNEDEEPTDVSRMEMEVETDARMMQQVRSLSIYNSHSAPIAENWLEANVPNDIIVSIFTYLDPISKWSCSRVCSRWRLLIRENIRAEYWKRAVNYYFPLFQPICNVFCSFKVFGQMLQSTACIECLQNFANEADNPTRNMISVWVSRRLCSEECKILEWDGIYARPVRSSRIRWVGWILGPVGSPYEGGKFYLTITVPQQYPMYPLKVRFVTKIFHPNVSVHGEIGLDLLAHGKWCAGFAIPSVLLSIQSLLTDPNCCISMELGAVAHLYTDRREVFNAIAQMWTWKFAMTEHLVG